MEAKSPALIFIIDDSPTNLRILFDVLKQAGFKVLIATNGIDALNKLENIVPDLILLDVKMPGIDGFEVCRRCKCNPTLQEVPIIFMTALSEIEYKVRGLALGAVDYITKPCQQEEVLSRVFLHLKLHQLTLTLKEKNEHLTQEISARQIAENQLYQLNRDLEQRVFERTQELSQVLEQLRSQEEQLRYEATHDALTGLLNRSGLIHYLSNLVQDSQPHGIGQLGVLLIDLDRFKNINDRFGYLVGDDLLKGVASRLQSNLEGLGTIARLGGDEFLIVLENPRDINGLEQIAKRLLIHLQYPFSIDSYSISMKASIGILPSILGYQEPKGILRDANIALHQAKKQGQGCYAVLTSQMQIQALERIQLESDLRRGIEQEEFCLYFQPIFCLRNQQLTGFEALARWQHPQRGLLTPDKFIPLAEETGMIQALDLWAFKTACQQLQSWQKQFDILPTINVNFSALLLQRSDIAEIIQLMCYKSGLSPVSLKLEITESAFLEASSKATQVLDKINHMGFKLCIDDFGTGYSSLSRLHTFPTNTLKIDRSFVSRINQSSEGKTIVQTIINLAHNLGLDIVAEGIETQEQLVMLQALGCERGQGYLFSKPLSSDKAEQLLVFYRSKKMSEYEQASYSFDR